MKELAVGDIRLTDLVRSGDTIIWSQGTSEPVTLIEALIEQRRRIGKVRVFLGSSYSDCIRPEHADAIEVDLTGAVNGEIANGGYMGTVGGLTDFSRAAAMSPRGRSIIVLPSRTRDGAISRIVARLTDGVATAARADADVVVTEYGAAELRGKTIGERVRSMINIAHPDFRESLGRAAREQIAGMV